MYVQRAFYFDEDRGLALLNIGSAYEILPYLSWYNTRREFQYQKLIQQIIKFILDFLKLVVYTQKQEGKRSDLST